MKISTGRFPRLGLLGIYYDPRICSLTARLSGLTNRRLTNRRSGC
jgi:hypothetical protein